MQKPCPLMSDALVILGAAGTVILVFARFHTMDEPVLAHHITRKLRAAYPDLPIIARAPDSAHAAELYRAGASTAAFETLESSLQLSEAVLVAWECDGASRRLDPRQARRIP